MKEKTVIKVEQDPEKPIEKGVLAASIVEISSAIQKLQRGGLNIKAIEILTHANCGSHGFGTKPGIGDVRLVIQSLRELEQKFCR